MIIRRGRVAAALAFFLLFAVPGSAPAAAAEPAPAPVCTAPVPGAPGYVVADPDCDLDGTPLVGRPRPIRAALKLSIGFGGHLAAVVLRRPEGPRRGPEAPGATRWPGSMPRRPSGPASAWIGHCRSRAPAGRDA